jgi:hypothetical protein
MLKSFRAISRVNVVIKSDVSEISLVSVITVGPDAGYRDSETSDFSLILPPAIARDDLNYNFNKLRPFFHKNS